METALKFSAPEEGNVIYPHDRNLNNMKDEQITTTYMKFKILLWVKEARYKNVYAVVFHSHTVHKQAKVKPAVKSPGCSFLREGKL